MTDGTSLNKEYFDKDAASYDAKHEKALNYIVEKIRARLDLIGVDWVNEDDDSEAAAAKKSVRLLDYACGTGNLTRALAPYTTQCVGIDLSEGMVAAYNTRARNQGLSEDEMIAHQGDLCSASDPDPTQFSGPTFRDFDVAGVGLAFHHFNDPGLAARRLAARLRSGGVLFILDFLVDADHAGSGGDHGHDHQHPAMATVMHHGFTEEGIKKIFEDAGAGVGFRAEEIGTISTGNSGAHTDGSGKGLVKRVFIARGTKA